MDTLLQMRQAVQSALNSGSESSFFTDTVVDGAINTAYRKAGGLFPWAELEDALKTSTEEDHEYYEYPVNWRPDSIWKLEVNGRDMGDPLVFKDYLHETENNFPNGVKSIWSSQWRRFFIRLDGVAPTTNGNNNISIWGIKTVETLTLDTDTTIFSYSLPECNDALVLEATAIMRAKSEEERRSEFKSAEALRIFTITYGRLKKSQAKYEKTTPFLDVPDFFASRKSRSRTRRGNFDIDW